MQNLEGTEPIGPKTGKKSDLLIAIPCYNERELLLEHLKLLDRQIGAKFDVLAVLGNVFEEKTALELLKQKHNFSLILIKRAEDTGSAGGFFAAQKFALEEGYEFLIMADVDCLPADDGVVAALYAHHECGYVSPTEIFEREGGLPAFVPQASQRAKFTPIYHYTLISSRLMKKYGLVFAPAYHGAEDAEYAQRLAGETRVFVEERVRHPFIIGDKTYRKLDRFWAYTLNTILLVRGKRYALNLARYLLSSLTMFFFFPPYGRAMARKMMELLFNYIYGKKAMQELKVDMTAFLSDASALPKNARRVSYSQYLTLGALGAEMFQAKFANFRKEIVIEGSANDLLITMQAAWAKKAYYKTGEQYLLIADNSSLLVHALKIIAFALAFLPFMAVSFVAFMFIKLARGPRTIGYGL